MVFACLTLSVFATIEEYEQTASLILFYMVSQIAAAQSFWLARSQSNLLGKQRRERN